MNLPRIGDVTVEGEDRWLVHRIVRDGTRVVIRELLVPEGEEPAGLNKTWSAVTTSDRERVLVKAT